MTIEEMMKYVESEFVVINNTPCEICGGYFMLDISEVSIIDGICYNISECICEKCTHEKQFLFPTPYLNDHDSTNFKSKLN